MTDPDRFLLKDHLFNRQKVEQLANELVAVSKTFDTSSFTQAVVEKFPELELMERAEHIADILELHLPNSYRDAVAAILAALPESCDPMLTDNDFGDFIYLPYGMFVARNGSAPDDVEFSLDALKAITTRFSMEWPIRTFVNLHPQQTFETLKNWTRDEHYHVRRLVSEGTRPKLPWAKKLDVDYHLPIELLDVLYADDTRYVTRSVANHLNDIAKIDPVLVVQTIERWQKEGEQSQSELLFIIRHALRTLVKNSDQKALRLLGFERPKLQVHNFALAHHEIALGSALEYEFDLVSTSARPQSLLIDYVLSFKKANGELAPKIFKLKQVVLAPRETIHLKKRHPLRLMTTRKLYPGTHSVELQINGERFGAVDFELVE